VGTLCISKIFRNTPTFPFAFPYSPLATYYLL
jgi:hypothetical protein